MFIHKAGLIFSVCPHKLPNGTLYAVIHVDAMMAKCYCDCMVFTVLASTMIIHCLECPSNTSCFNETAVNAAGSRKVRGIVYTIVRSVTNCLVQLNCVDITHLYSLTLEQLLLCCQIIYRHTEKFN